MTALQLNGDDAMKLFLRNPMWLRTSTLSIAVALLCFGLVSCQTNTPKTWATPAGASTALINGYPLTYTSRGTGPTVVFVGGVLTDYRYWQRPLAEWEKQYRVVAISQRHFFPEKWNGKGSDFGVDQHAKDLEAFIESLGSPVFLVGWSYGAHVSFEAARERPDLVKKLVLAEAPLYSLLSEEDADASAIQARRAKEAEKLFAEGKVDEGLQYSIDSINGEGAWARIAEPVRQTIRDNAWTIVGIGRDESARVTCATFGTLRMPVLLVQGELTTPRFHRLVSKQSECLPQAKVVTIPTAGHTSPSTNPPAFHTAVIEFLQR